MASLKGTMTPARPPRGLQRKGGRGEGQPRATWLGSDAESGLRWALENVELSGLAIPKGIQG